MRWFTRKKRSMHEPNLDVAPVDKMILLAEDISELANELRQVTLQVRQEYSDDKG